MIIKTYLLDAIEYNHVMTVYGLRQYLWQDEIHDLFLLTKNMEVYLYSGYTQEEIGNSVLGCYCWSYKTMALLRSIKLIFDLWATDDGLYTFKTKIENLPFILNTGTFRKRPHINGKWVKSREVKLGHRIIPYRPVPENEMVFDKLGILCNEEVYA